MEPIQLLLDHPARVMRSCGFTLLRDDLHGKWMHDMLTGRGDMTLLAHRGSYKTTCDAGVLAFWMILHGTQNSIFLRKGEDDVVEVVRQVRKILETEYMEALTFRLFGSPLKIIRASATALTADTFISPRGGEQLLGIGIGGSLTGKHADLIMTDDIVNLKDRISHAERERTRGIYQELQNIKNPAGRMINTGTPWHKDDAFELMPAPQVFSVYDTGILTPAQIDAKRRSMTPSLFAANYELRHIAAENALFTEPPVFGEDESDIFDGIAHMDAAYGGEDYTALTCARRDGDQIFMYGRLWRAHVDTVLDAALNDVDRLRCGPVYVETNGDKGYLSKEIRRRGVPTRPYAEKQNKYLKISTYLRKWWPNIVWIPGTDPEYIAQIQDYTEDAGHDDAPDSAACACRRLDKAHWEE